MGEPLAIFPMYDWPETRSANDRFWERLRISLKDHGFEAPKALTRTDDPFSVWTSEELLLGQTCGLPYVQQLRDSVSLVGTPAYEIDCGAGSYFSVLIVAENSSIASLSDLQGARLGYNGPLSQSGFAAFYFHLKCHGIDSRILGNSLQTGSHRASVSSVANGEVDVAAIDAVSWEMAKRHEPAAKKVRVLSSTEPTPGLPVITRLRSDSDVDKLHMSVVEAMASLEEETRATLMLLGFAATTEADYRVVADRYREISADQVA